MVQYKTTTENGSENIQYSSTKRNCKTRQLSLANRLTASGTRRHKSRQILNSM